jgi:hypothetical protein
MCGTLTFVSVNDAMTSSVGVPFLILSNESSMALIDAEMSVSAVKDYWWRGEGEKQCQCDFIE